MLAPNVSIFYAKVTATGRIWSDYQYLSWLQCENALSACQGEVSRAVYAL